MATKRQESVYGLAALKRVMAAMEDAYPVEAAFEEFVKNASPSKPIEQAESDLGLSVGDSYNGH